MEMAVSLEAHQATALRPFVQRVLRLLEQDGRWRRVEIEHRPGGAIDPRLCDHIVVKGYRPGHPICFYQFPWMPGNRPELPPSLADRVAAGLGELDDEFRAEPTWSIRATGLVAALPLPEP